MFIFVFVFFGCAHDPKKKSLTESNQYAILPVKEVQKKTFQTNLQISRIQVHINYYLVEVRILCSLFWSVLVYFFLVKWLIIILVFLILVVFYKSLYIMKEYYWYNALTTFIPILQQIEQLRRRSYALTGEVVYKFYFECLSQCDYLRDITLLGDI